ncbi:magnesium chelatase (plasmid) [Exiguobacterium sp. N4-1P]|uniref:AAA family ATPase n=1 Tax=Exiguobacterium sp. N4-1P TaxID=2051906 RepID=UPI000B58C1BA|nr:MoxR family ATPase [Exiguobacterium sp. N4-1P]ASI36886.1 magnesium chelatase [Exiguobacterium sp. N4-1P]ASI37659.1 magnesium chelatase [Exiguobacterium sp. N4-1P]
MHIQELLKEINTIYLGKPEVVELCFTALLADGHILLEDVPGTGKTMLAKTISDSFHGKFSRIQFTADLLPSDIIGTDFFNLKTQEFENKQGPIFSNIVLIDEINRAVPRTQSALLEAMEERQVTIGRETYLLPSPFFVIATQNPIESSGTFPLPDAQLDRFMMCLNMGYPESHYEVQLLEEIMTSTRRSTNLSISFNELIEQKKSISNIIISKDILQYIVDLAGATRSHRYVETGVSPRATIALAKAARSYAYLKNRDFVIPEDIKHLAPFVLAHRLTLSIEGEIKTTKQEILLEILGQVHVPVEVGM